MCLNSGLTQIQILTFSGGRHKSISFLKVYPAYATAVIDIDLATCHKHKANSTYVQEYIFMCKMSKFGAKLV